MRQSRVAFLALILYLLLLSASCSSTTSPPTTHNPNPTPTNTELDSTPKGPGGPALTATAQATPVATVCPAVKAASPISTTGWQTFRDPTYHFQFALPPAWRAGVDTQGLPSAEIDAVLPPGSTVPFGAASSQLERFAVSLTLSGSSYDPTQDTTVVPEPKQVLIDGVQATLYDRTSPDCQTIERISVAHIGQHDYTFYMSSTPKNVDADSQLFMSIVGSFKA